METSKDTKSYHEQKYIKAARDLKDAAAFCQRLFPRH